MKMARVFRAIFFAAKVLPRMHEGRKKHEVMQRMGFFSPRRLEGTKKHEGMQRMGFAKNARMIMECVIFDVMFQRSTSLIRTISTEKLRAINKKIL